MKIKISGIIEDSVVDGPGLRTVIFTQGCNHNCPGCHNPHTHDREGGYWIESYEIIDKIISNPIVQGVTFSGGEPFLWIDRMHEIIKQIKTLRPELNIIVYTGYLWEDLYSSHLSRDILRQIDILIDGPYVHELRDISLKYRGSSNQRIIDAVQSMKENQIILADL